MVQNEQCISISVSAKSKNNTLIIQHYGKNFGQNGQWDTVSKDNVIVQDRAVKLLDIELDDVSIANYVVHQCMFETDNGERLNTDYYGFNGKIEINFDSPVYEWIIDTIVKPKSRRLLDLSQPVETSANNLFEYEQDQRELAELETILEHNAHLFGKSSTLRNT